MDVLEFADYDIREQIWPHNEKVLDTSTHDTSTLVGFCQKSFCSNGDEQGARYLAGEIMRHALDSPGDARHDAAASTCSALATMLD